MPAKIYRVQLTPDERKELETTVNCGKGAAQRLTRARILLLADENRQQGGLKDADIADVLGITSRTVERVRQNCVLNGTEAAITHSKPIRTRSRKLDGASEAALTQIACTKAPEGRTSWTIELMRDRLLEMKVVDSVSKETVRPNVEKNELKPWLNEQWCIPPKENADFVCAMEEVLDVYQQPMIHEDPWFV